MESLQHLTMFCRKMNALNALSKASSTRPSYLAGAVLLSLLPAASCFAAASINVPLTVQEALYAGGSTGVARTNEAVTLGVPLPDSAGITSTNIFGLTGATAAQFSIEGKWPSGNIKWLKIRAIVPSVAVGGTATVT